jgi:ribosomal protein S18 acetylase RimI-like enzyme
MPRPYKREGETLDTTITKTIALPDAPSIPGLTFRHYKGEEDYPDMMEVNNGSKIADEMGHDLHTLDTIRYVYGTTPNHDPYKDVLMAEVGGKMVAYKRLYWERELDGPRLYWHYGFVLPEWRGKGLGRAMMRWVEERAREIEATREDEGQAYISTSAYSNMTGMENLLKADGYEPVRYAFHMQTPDLDHIPDKPMPEGLEVRPVKPEHYRAIWQASSEAFQDEWGATTANDEDYERWVNDFRNEPELWRVAWDGDEVVGVILNYINHDYNARTGRKLGYTEGISVRRPWRRRGLASSLLALSMKMFKEMGMAQTALGVDTENPSGALRVYESMGYKVVSQSTVYRKELR